MSASRFSLIEWLDQTGSTNADLMAQARAGATEQVLVADYQTAGRGRLGRSWQAPPGASLLCSVLVRPQGAASDPHLVTTAAGLAVADACAAVAGFDARLKWPNDCVAVGAGHGGSDLKVAGVLAEALPADPVAGGSGLEGPRVAAVVVGIGLNVNWGGSLPAEIATTATSLDQLIGRSVDRAELLVAMLRSLESHLDAAARPGGAAELRRRHIEKSATVGRTVRVEYPDHTEVGQAVDVSETGHLVLDVGGALHEVAVGDIVHLRIDG